MSNSVFIKINTKNYLSLSQLNSKDISKFDLKDIITSLETSIYIYKLTNNLITDNGLIISEDGNPIKDSIIRDWQIPILLEELKVKYNNDLDLENLIIKNSDIHFLEGEYISLLAPWDFTFWHWIVEQLTKVALAEHFGFKGKYIFSPQNKFMIDSLSLLGISEDRIFIANKNKTFKVDKLYLNEKFKIYSGETIVKILEMLRNKILSRTKLYETIEKKRIYISRKNSSNNRKIVNEKEVIDLLVTYGFEITIMENLSFKEQIEIVQDAECLIGGNGSGMIHCLFMLPKSLLIEFFSPNYTTSAMFPSIELLDHTYHMITSNSNGIYELGESSDVNIVVPIDLLKVTLDNYFDKKF
jgi:hypothetical protein